MNPLTAGLYPVVFHYAFDLDTTDPVEAVVAKATPGAMADLLAELPSDQASDLVWRLVSNHDRNVDEWRDALDLYAQTLDEVAYRAQSAFANETPYPHDVLTVLLEQAAGIDRDEAWRFEGPLTDPAFLSFYLLNAPVTNSMDARALNNALRAVDADADALVGDVLHHMAVVEELPPTIVAETLGYLLAQGDVLGDSVSLDGVTESLVKSAVSAGPRTPLTAPLVGVFDALNAEFERMEGNLAALDDAYGSNAHQNLLAITLYTTINGEPPGMSDWVQANGWGDNPDAPLAWFAQERVDSTAVYREINALSVLIDEARDE